MFYNKISVVPTKQCRFKNTALFCFANTWFFAMCCQKLWHVTDWNYWPALFCRDYQDFLSLYFAKWHIKMVNDVAGLIWLTLWNCETIIHNIVKLFSYVSFFLLSAFWSHRLGCCLAETRYQDFGSPSHQEFSWEYLYLSWDSLYKKL